MIEYLVRLTCDGLGGHCGVSELFEGTSSAITDGWSMISNSGGWLCPPHSREWRELHSPSIEPTDEDLLA